VPTHIRLNSVELSILIYGEKDCLIANLHSKRANERFKQEKGIDKPLDCVSMDIPSTKTTIKDV
jgi:hypothetical protein